MRDTIVVILSKNLDIFFSILGTWPEILGEGVSQLHWPRYATDT